MTTHTHKVHSVCCWYFISAISTISLVGLCVCVCTRTRVCIHVCVFTGIIWNELIYGCANIVHTSSSFHPHRHTHSHTHTHLRTNGLTGLKVDVAFIFGYWATEQDDCDGKTLHASNETSVFSQHSETSQHSIHT